MEDQTKICSCASFCNNQQIKNEEDTTKSQLKEKDREILSLKSQLSAEITKRKYGILLDILIKAEKNKGYAFGKCVSEVIIPILHNKPLENISFPSILIFFTSSDNIKDFIVSCGLVPVFFNKDSVSGHLLDKFIRRDSFGDTVLTIVTMLGKCLQDSYSHRDSLFYSITSNVKCNYNRKCVFLPSKNKIISYLDISVMLADYESKILRLTEEGKKKVLAPPECELDKFSEFYYVRGYNKYILLFEGERIN